ncbi:MerR family transcriptional regulator [Candidatus Methylobacter oryzae]|uniref:MerR family transcriptional regulator n=1 Tax=Candidatus Methylobacter oryzae TaxID=2497749 RepID=A0ABY3CJ44_9GAMM|nr:MerR family transcriptional regulator [Candidatus Methylobacter oryzae]TRX03304.1 MerR family transcriptional regulator [Candidatus Methylobacter oryzae]
MLLKVGELAKRCGLTVRTLHHYDAIGLLAPSARSDSGYRLYNRNDIARLHQIQALRRFGLSLADIGAVLANPGSHLASIVDSQIQMLDRQIEQTTTLRDRLSQLQSQLRQGDEPELADWLTTLEMMTMYDKYFTKEEQRQLPFFKEAENSTADEWAAMVQSVREAMAMKIPPHSPGAQNLARRWIEMVVRDTNGDARVLTKLNAMHIDEPAVQAQTGVTPEVLRFIQEAWAETKYAIYQKYLSPDEFRFLRENYLKRTHEYPELIAAIRQHMEDGVAPDDPRMQPLAQQWLELFRSYAGDNPETYAKIREANAKEPELWQGTWIDQRLLGYVIEAMSYLKPC